MPPPGGRGREAFVDIRKEPGPRARARTMQELGLARVRQAQVAADRRVEEELGELRGCLLLLN